MSVPDDMNCDLPKRGDPDWSPLLDDSPEGAALRREAVEMLGKIQRGELSLVSKDVAEAEGEAFADLRLVVESSMDSLKPFTGQDGLSEALGRIRITLTRIIHRQDQLGAANARRDGSPLGSLITEFKAYSARARGIALGRAAIVEEAADEVRAITQAFLAAQGGAA